jgi:predicted alpha/beta superfamily hydrolase
MRLSIDRARVYDLVRSLAACELGDAGGGGTRRPLIWRIERGRNAMGSSRRTIAVAVAVAVAAVAVPSHGLSAQAPPIQTGTDAPSAAYLDYVPLYSRIFHNTRLLRVWLPPGYDDDTATATRYPVVYFADGVGTFLARRLDSIAGQLTARHAIVPTIFVGIDNGGSTNESRNPVRDRADEYLPYPDDPESWHPPLRVTHGRLFPAFLETEVRPLIERRFRVLTDPAHIGLAGSSYSGAVALFTVINRPGHYGMLLLESPSLYIGDRALLRAVRGVRALPTRVYIGVGTAEGATPGAQRSMVDNARELADFLGRQGERVMTCYVVIPGAEHGEPAWRARLPTALTFVLGASACPTPRDPPP